MIRTTARVSIASFALLLILVAFVGPSNGQSQSTSKNQSQSTSSADQTAYPPGGDSVVSALNALTTASTQALPLWRANERLQKLRKSVTENLLKQRKTDSGAVVPPGTGKLPKVIFEASILCADRGLYAYLFAQQTYLTAASTQIQKVATVQKIDSLSGALASLFANYAIDVTQPKKKQELENAASDICVSDLQNYRDTYYSYQLQTQNADFLAFMGPFGTLISTILGIISPPIEAGATLLDQQKRQANIRAFLKKNAKSLSDAAETLNNSIATLTQQRRFQLVGQFVEQLDLTNDIASVDLDKISHCKSAFDGNGSVIFVDQTLVKDGKPITIKVPGPDFVLCYRQVWNTYSDSIASALKLADQYDQLADSPPDVASKKLAQLTKLLTEFANNQTPSDADLKVAWNNAVLLATFAQAVITALSPDNASKVDKQITALVKAL